MRHSNKIIKVSFVLSLFATLLSAEWFDNGNFYQIYPRSFKDSDGDGVGDLKGIKSKLQYVKDLGIDGVWLSPIMKSPMYDFGYDISDYRDIHGEYGTLSDFDDLVAECKRIGIHLILDFVPNHSSHEHEWFKKSERNESGFEDFYIWRNPKIDEVSNTPVPPTNWLSVFRYSAWRWSELRQQMHMFQDKQPDLNYRNPQVVAEMKAILIYWLEKGVSGFRIDAIPALFEKVEADGSFQDEPRSYNTDCDAHDHCYLKNIYTEDQPETYDMVYQWRKLVDDYSKANNVEGKILMVESAAPIELNMKYYGNSSMEGAHFPFNFDLLLKLTKNSSATDYKTLIEEWLTKMPEGHMANWEQQLRIKEKLVMENVPISWEDTIDPLACNSPKEELDIRSRDPVRTPFPWDDSKNAGFSTGNKTWLPVGDKYKTVNVKAQEEATNSHLKIFRKLTAIRKETRFKNGTYDGHISNNGNIYSYKRQNGNDFAIIILNFGSTDEIVNLSGIYSNITSHLKVYTSSLESGFKDG
ncbi:maltase A1-like [Chironomus tepperi]|uniref:maltase A1-like n=1 Tax=Chironomus tepperi TaxID=113505 RepID=UPI00391FB161